MAEISKRVLRIGMRIWSVVALVVASLVGVTLLVQRHRPQDVEAIVEQQAQVPAPGGAIWCKSADSCPRRHVRRPD